MRNLNRCVKTDLLGKNRDEFLSEKQYVVSLSHVNCKVAVFNEVCNGFNFVNNLWILFIHLLDMVLQWYGFYQSTKTKPITCQYFLINLPCESFSVVFKNQSTAMDFALFFSWNFCIVFHNKFDIFFNAFNFFLNKFKCTKIVLEYRPIDLAKFECYDQSRSIWGSLHRWGPVHNKYVFMNRLWFSGSLFSWII